MKSIALVIAFLFLGLGFANAQDSIQKVRISVQVTEKDSSQKIPFALVVAKYNGVQKGFCQVGSDGKGTLVLPDTLDFSKVVVELKATGYAILSTVGLSTTNSNCFKLIDKSKINRFSCGPPSQLFSTPPGQFEMDADFIKHSAYR